MQTLFISDIHLSESSEDIRANFMQFLQEKAPNAQNLYFLGDIFNLWIGDDDNADWIQTIVRALKKLQDYQIKLYFMQGNRDFLLGKTFAEMCGATLLPDPTVIDLYEIPTLLTHGDLLCTGDTQYQRWRKLVHFPWVRKFILSSPRSWRQNVAKYIRNKSRHTKQQLSAEKMDVSLSFLDAWVEKYKVKQVIHGHTHLPAIHQMPTYTRFVLPAWHPTGGMISAKPNITPELILF